MPLHADQKAYDYIIKGAFVLDGESLIAKKQDIGISGSHISVLGEIAPIEGKEVIDAQGLIAAPGFIDIHTHSDFNPFVYPELGNKVLQGVTTEVVGNCGMSAAPFQGLHETEMAKVWSREGVEIPPTIAWNNFEDYADEAEFRGLDTNFLGLVGHGNLRSSVIGMKPRKLEPDEIPLVEKLLDEAMDQGAIGISFGLIYLPGIFASHEELVKLCRLAGEKGGICTFHIRSEGKELIEAIREAIEIGKEANAPVHISHLKAAGQKNWPQIDEALRLIEEARASGQRVTADVYPYTAGFAELAVALPHEIYEDPDRVARFQDPHQRKALISELEEYFQNNPASWDNIRVATVTQEKNFPFRGKTLSEAAKIRNKSPVETLVELLAGEDFKVSAFYFGQNEHVIDQILAKPYAAIGSDSIADGSAMPHPRAYGTFPRLLSRCTAKSNVASNPCWSRAVHQMSTLPAKILNLKLRGKIVPGYFADIVLFNPATVKDQADYEHPKTPPTGIEWVFVNGKPAVQKGKYQAVRAGLFLKREK